MDRVKPLQWDVMSRGWRYAALSQFDFSDLPGSRAEWVDMDWEHLPADIRFTLRQMGSNR